MAAISKMAEIRGLEEANTANHEALKVGLIELDMFQAAARYLVKLRLSLSK